MREDAPLDVPSPEMVAIYRRMSGAERLAIASRMYVSARNMLINHLRTRHPDWDEQAVIREAARRLSHGAV